MIKMSFALLLALMTCSGCATITKGKTDTVLVQISNCSESISCEATNKKGRWDFSAPGPVTFDKSDQDLTIQCSDGPEKLTLRITPTKSSMVWGNVLVGGIIGGGVDASTDAHWDIVDSVTMTRNYCFGSRVSQSMGAVPTPAPRTSGSSLRSVDQTEKDSCEFINTITRGSGGQRESTLNIERAMNLALDAAAVAGANSYFVVKADTTTSGATVIVEALNCS